MNPDIEFHPCFSESAHSKVYRIHLPVAPQCNAKCAFCSGGCQTHPTKIPGLTERLITPFEALNAVTRIANKLNEPHVIVGIAGPGDPLASGHAIETLRLIPKTLGPNKCRVVKCLSTNGIELQSNVEQLVEAGVHFITVSIHSTDPRTTSMMVPEVFLDGSWQAGDEAARALINRQLAGIEKATELGLICKVNVVLVKDVNLDQVTDIALAAKNAGAQVINPIPVIPPCDRHGITPPSRKEMQIVYDELSSVMDTFTLCKRCRADACGIPGGSDGLLWDQAEAMSWNAGLRSP